MIITIVAGIMCFSLVVWFIIDTVRYYGLCNKD